MPCCIGLPWIVEIVYEIGLVIFSPKSIVIELPIIGFGYTLNLVISSLKVTAIILLYLKDVNFSSGESAWQVPENENKTGF